MFPAFLTLILQVSIPDVVQNDELMWKHSTYGDFLLKEAYEFKSQQLQ